MKTDAWPKKFSINLLSSPNGDFLIWKTWKMTINVKKIAKKFTKKSFVKKVLKFVVLKSWKTILYI